MTRLPHTYTTCQICARPIKSKNGFIAHHGYERPHRGSGWQTASCHGARHVPYEVGHDALDKEIPRLTAWIAARKTEIAAFIAVPPDTLTIEKYQGAHKKPLEIQVSRPDGFSPDNSWGRTMPHSYEYAYFKHKDHVEAMIESASEHLAFMTKRRADWKAPVDEAVETVTALMQKAQETGIEFVPAPTVTVAPPTCVRCGAEIAADSDLSLCSTCDAKDAEILAREERVNFFNAVSTAMKKDRLSVSQDDDDNDTDDDEPSFESLIDINKWTETRAILTRDPETGTITVTPQPLTDEQQGLLALAESIADGIESGAIVLLTDEQASFMRRVARHEGLVVYPRETYLVAMAAQMEARGLVTVDRSTPRFIVVSVVGGEGEDI